MNATNEMATPVHQSSEEELIAKAAAQVSRARMQFGLPPETSGSELRPTFSLAPNGKCRRCGVDVGPELFICTPCDRAVEDALQARALRDRKDAIERELVRSNLPRDYRTGARTTADLPETAADALRLAALLGSLEVPGLFLFGESQTFKTTFAAAWLAGEIRKGGSGRFADVADLMTDIMATYSDATSESRAAIVARFADTPMLVLDDLGQEKASKHAGEVLRQILDNRRREWRPGRWLIVTTNRTPEALRDRFEEIETGNAILHRIAQLTVAVPMERA
jgi:DNA replication protein DnaC